MTDYIEREKFKNILETKAEMAIGTPKAVFYNAAKMLDLLPAADVVEVVRCKDCAFYKEIGPDFVYKGRPAQHCTWHNTLRGANEFCNCGIRRTDE